MKCKCRACQLTNKPEQVKPVLVADYLATVGNYVEASNNSFQLKFIGFDASFDYYVVKIEGVKHDRSS